MSARPRSRRLVAALGTTALLLPASLGLTVGAATASEGEQSVVTEEQPSEETPPAAEDAPPAAEDAPPAAEDAPPATEEVPPATEEVPPAAEEAPPATEEAPPAEKEDTPPAEEVPPAPEEVPPAEDGDVRPLVEREVGADDGDTTLSPLAADDLLNPDPLLDVPGDGPPLPVLVDDTATVPSGSTVAVDVLANDKVTPAASPVVAISTAPGHGDATVVDGVVTYVASDRYSGPDTLVYSVTDLLGRTVTGTVSLLVTPVANDDFAVTQSGVPVDVAIFANDLGLLQTFEIVDPPDHGTVEVITAPTSTVAFPVGARTTRIRYTPDAGFVGRDTMVYRVSDPSGQSDDATVTFDVFAPPTPPVPPTPPPAVTPDVPPPASGSSGFSFTPPARESTTQVPRRTVPAPETLAYTGDQTTALGGLAALLTGLGVTLAAAGTAISRRRR